MGFFDFFRSKKETPAETTPEAEKELNLADTDPAQHASSNGVASIDSVYAFLQSDYESTGYNDAMTNPDDSYKNDNISLLKQDLFILINKSLTYYERLLIELDFHIGSRSRAGLIDLVEELKSRKEMVSGHIAKIKVIQSDALNSNGAAQRIVLSYQKGFMRGLSALSHSDILSRKL